LIRNDFNNVFRAPSVLQSNQPYSKPKGVDILIHPSAIRSAPLLHRPENEPEANSLDSYLQDVLTVPASLAGLPALSVPAGLAEDGWPVGISLVGQWGRDKDVLCLGGIIESVCH
jgi:aspartyl-tRNA(Asn)/glutamyl-tRNA(Gln) amidotransferase subunit A